MIREAARKSQNHYEVRQLVEDICRDVASKDYLSECLAIYHYVCARTRYMRDPRTVELIRAPYLIAIDLRHGRRVSGDCDDLSALLVAMFMATGAQCRIVTVAFRDVIYKGDRQYSHVFCQVREPKTGRWITFDPVAGLKTREMLARATHAKVWNV